MKMNSDKMFSIFAKFLNVILAYTLSIGLCYAQENQADVGHRNDKNYFEESYQEFKAMLENNQELSFKRAVFLTENSFLEYKANYEYFCREIKKLSYLCGLVQESGGLQYTKNDKNEVLKNASIFRVLCDTLITVQGRVIYPFEYDFQDFAGKQDWTNMFVSKLLATRKGNCHSLPYLYKILAEEIGAKAWLSLAPNHIYIKCRSEQTGWYNTELTSRMFPVDAWLMASGYINKQTLVSGIYMDTLSLEQSIALCVVDLGKGFERKFADNDGKFVIECANLALKHYPNCVNAMLLKAEAKTKQYQNTQNQAEKVNLMREMNQLYTQIYETGYREMPEWMYLEWLFSLPNEQSKYQNRTLDKDKR
jgi:hypothetical protein